MTAEDAFRIRALIDYLKHLSKEGGWVATYALRHIAMKEAKLKKYADEHKTK